MLELGAVTCNTFDVKLWVPHLFFPTLKVVEELFDALMWHLPEITFWEVRGRKRILKITNEALEPEFPFMCETSLSQR